jgi:hypothetical protein
MDMSDIKVTLYHEQVEEVIRRELHDAIRSHKKEINSLELSNVHPEHEDLVYSKQLIKAAAVVLSYYSVPTDWEALDEISNGK